MNGEARSTTQIDDGDVRVTRYDLEPGDRIAWHRHEHDYLVVPLTDGAFDVMSAGVASPQLATAGESYRRVAGAEHELINGARPYSFIEIELIDSGTGNAPVSMPG